MYEYVGQIFSSVCCLLLFLVVFRSYFFRFRFLVSPCAGKKKKTTAVNRTRRSSRREREIRDAARPADERSAGTARRKGAASQSGVRHSQTIVIPPTPQTTSPRVLPLLPRVARTHIRGGTFFYFVTFQARVRERGSPGRAGARARQPCFRWFGVRCPR